MEIIPILLIALICMALLVGLLLGIGPVIDGQELILGDTSSGSACLFSRASG